LAHFADKTDMQPGTHCHWHGWKCHHRVAIQRVGQS